MVTIDRLRGLGQICDLYTDCSSQGGQTIDPTDVTGNSSIWANVLNTVGQLGTAFAPVVRNITTPFATYSSVGPYGSTMSSIPISTAAMSPGGGVLQGGYGAGIGGGSLLLIGAVALFAIMASKGH